MGDNRSTVTLEDMFSLTSFKYNDSLNSVENVFIKQLYLLAVQNIQRKRLVEIIPHTFDAIETDVAKKLLNTDDSILNICDMPAMFEPDKYSSIVEEVAKYRWDKLGFSASSDYWKEIASLLFLDYLLSSCLCFVEVYENDNSGYRKAPVDKFYATRNRFIAGKLAGIEDEETVKYVTYLSPVLEDYQLKSLRVLKLNRRKTGFKITQPRSAVNFNKVVKITPLFFIKVLVSGVVPMLKQGIIKFHYIKDNGQERELISTLSKDIISKYYGGDYAERVLAGAEFKFDRGYLKLPELGASKYDETGLRAVNITRITKIEQTDSFDTAYMDVDFNSIIPTFKATIEVINNPQIIGYIYKGLLGKEVEEKSNLQLKSEIISYVDSRFAIGTTTFQKELHNYMIQNNGLIFKGYTGQPVNLVQDTEWNLGIEIK